MFLGLYSPRACEHFSTAVSVTKHILTHIYIHIYSISSQTCSVYSPTSQTPPHQHCLTDSLSVWLIQDSKNSLLLSPSVIEVASGDDPLPSARITLLVLIKDKSGCPTLNAFYLPCLSLDQCLILYVFVQQTSSRS